MAGRNLQTWFSLLALLALTVWAAVAFCQPDAGTDKAGANGARPATTAPAQSADEVLGQMLRPRRQGQQRELTYNEPPAADRTSGDAAVKPNAPLVTVMREGTPIVNRVGRLTLPGRGANHSGQAEFTFLADGQALRDPPLVILPNLKLMAMEEAVRGQSRDLRFRVSGIVTEYRGRNYVLLEKVSVVGDVTQQFVR